MEYFENISHILGPDHTPFDLAFNQLLVRAFLVYLVMFAMMRVAGRRFLAKKNAFDILLAFLMASLMSRAINGSAPFWETLALGLIVAATHRMLAWLACRFHGFGAFLKGRTENW